MWPFTSSARPSRGGFVPTSELDTGDGTTVERVVDEEAGVVVYALCGDDGSGLAAVPIDETSLGGER